MGLSSAAIQRRIDAGRLHRIHPGIYAVGHRRLAREGRWMAAVLSGGESAVLMHASAAALHGFAQLERGVIHVNGNGRRGPTSVRMHRAGLGASEVVTKSRIPVTTVPRTLLDLAADLGDWQLERALREALFRNHTSLPALRRCLSRHQGERGARALRQAVENAQDAPGRFRSNPEQRFARWLRRHRLPLPEFNVYMRIGELEIEADCYWREQRLVVELDDRSTHAQRRSFEEDRIRDRTVQAHGLKAIRIAEPYDDGLHADLAALLEPQH